jgi:hypothetical protein
MSFADAYSAANHPEYRYAKLTKDGLWGIYYPRTDNDFDREKWEREKAEPKKERDRYQSVRSKAALSAEAKNRDIRAILGQLTLNETDRQRLNRRGLTNSQINEIGYVSVKEWQPIQGNIRYGVNRKGNLNNPWDGILCPIRNRKGQLIALRLHNPNRRPKYLSFKGSNLKSGEFPIAVYGQNLASGIVGISEGLEFKSPLASYRLGIPVIGHNGTTFTSSPLQTQATLEDLGASIIRLYPDGGVIGNPGLVAQYKTAIALYESWGYLVEIAWWGQTNKSQNDIDEINDTHLASIQYLTPDEFLALCPGHQGNQFKDWLGKQFKRLKPKGFGVSQDDSQEFEGNHAKSWMNTNGDVQDVSFMGSGKTYDICDVENPDGKIWLVYTDHRNPTNDRIKAEFIDLAPRNEFGQYRDKNGKLRLADANTPRELIEIEGNCNRAGMFSKLTNLGHNPNQGKEVDGKNVLNPICSTCPLAGSCGHTVGMYRHERKEALKAPKIRCHISSMPSPDDYDYSNDLVFYDEPSQGIKPAKVIQSDRTQLLTEAYRYRESLTDDQWSILDELLGHINPLFDDKKRYGLNNIVILDSLSTITDLDALIEALESNPYRLQDIFVESDGFEIGQKERREYAGANKTAKAHFRRQSYEESLDNLSKLPPNALIYVLKGIRGDKGISLRIVKGKLSITVDDRESFSKIINSTKKNIFLDATKNIDDLKKISGLQRPITVIRKKQDEPLKNLTIHRIIVKGLRSNSVSDDAMERLQTITDTLKTTYGDFKIIGPKSFMKPKGDRTKTLDLDGWWFNHSRGTNDFAGESNLAFVGMPRLNIGAIQDEYFALNGTLEGWEDHYRRLMNEEILQGVGGRQRASRYPDQQFNAFVLVGETKDDDDFEWDDLSWLETYGAKVITKTAFEINPQAGSEVQCTRHKIFQAIKECLDNGIKTTQAAIAKVIGQSQQAISKTLKQAGISLHELSKIIDEFFTTSPNKSSIRSGCIFDWVYSDFAWFFDLPVDVIAVDLIQAIQNGGMTGFKEYLANYPNPAQGKLLGILWTLLQDDQDFLTEQLKT